VAAPSAFALPSALAPVLALVLAALVHAAPQDAPDAEALWAAGQRQSALTALQAQLDAQPGDAALRLCLAQRQSEAGLWQASLRTAEGLGPEADRLRGTALYILTRFEEALPLLDPSDPAHCLMRLDSLLALGRLDEADAALAAAAAVRGAGDAELAALRGRLLAARGHYAEAAPAFREALAADPLDRAALFGLGQALVRTGEREEGLALLERHRALLPLLDRHDFALQSLDLDPLHADHHAQLGDIERELHLIDSAEARYRRAEELAAPSELVPVVLRHARLLAEDRGAPPAAIELLDAAAARVPDPRLAVRAADLLLSSGHAADAVARLERLAQQRPGDAAIRQRLQAARAAASAAAPPERP
jgi:tetratricopeptide (TPR) repeat protein